MTNQFLLKKHTQRAHLIDSCSLLRARVAQGLASVAKVHTYTLIVKSARTCDVIGINVTIKETACNQLKLFVRQYTNTAIVICFCIYSRVQTRLSSADDLVKRNKRK
jgi:hypothetical protein